MFLQHQTESLKFLETIPGALDMSDPGTGKTLVHIANGLRLINQGASCVLVVAPKALLKAAWGADIERFFPNVTYSIATAKNREEAFKADAQFYITNYDALPWIRHKGRKFYKRFSEVVIFDEATALKHRTSQRSKAAAEITKYTDNVFCLSASMLANHITHVWHPAKLVDKGQRLGPVFFDFQAATCTPHQVGPSANNIKWVEKLGARDAVANRLRDITIRHRLEECTDIPENQQITTPFELLPRHRKIYEEFKKESYLAFTAGKIVGINGAVAAGKMLQIASGAVYYGDGSYEVIDRSRYELIADLVEEREQVVFFYLWNHQLDETKTEFQKRGITFAQGTSDRAINTFKSGDAQVLMVHPQSAAHGLTLVNARTTLWASPSGDQERMTQGAGRIYRIGQDQKTQNIIIVAKDTIEETAIKRLHMRSASENSFLDLMSEYFKGAQ